jgi:hypothetical protein
MVCIYVKWPLPTGDNPIAVNEILLLLLLWSLVSRLMGCSFDRVYKNLMDRLFDEKGGKTVTFPTFWPWENYPDLMYRNIEIFLSRISNSRKKPIWQTVHFTSSEPNCQHSDPRIKHSICEANIMNNFDYFFFKSLKT